MKKTATLFTALTIAALLMITAEVISFSGGAPTNASGSPGDNNMTCVQCHASNVNQRFNWITSSELANGYAPGTTYSMQAKAEQAGCTKFGFLITIEKEDGTKAGVPVATDAARTQVVSTNYITHTSAGTAGQDEAIWDFQWTAPSNPMGWVALYGAFVGANGNNQNTGDIVYVSRKNVFLQGTQGIEHQSAQNTNRMFVYPNPANTVLHVVLEDGVTSSHGTIYDLTGRKMKEILWEQPNLMKVDVSSLPEGVYLLHLQWKEDHATAKVVVRR
jgi:hypothetical protein